MTAVAETKKELTEDEIAALRHIYLGPTWKRTEEGKWLLPEKTLGWQIAAWCADYLRAPDGSGPWRFTPEQLRFLLWWYAVDPHSGRFVYRTGVLQRCKGWGKDPLLAVICMVEFVGPSRFSHWGEDGQPVGKPHSQSLVQVAAVSVEQTNNTVDMFPAIISQRAIDEYGIKLGSELIRARGGRKLQPVTRNYRALEGKRGTFVVLNETQHWVTGNNGMQMFQTIDGNSTKMDSRYLAITNAFLPGEDSVGEKMRAAFEAIEAGLSVDVGFLYDSVEANPLTPLTEEALRIVLPIIRGDSVWLNVDAIVQSALNPMISVARSRRMYLNQIVADDDAMYTAGDLDKIVAKDRKLESGDEIVLGFDGGKTDDSTALVAIRIKDRTAFVLGLWEKPDHLTRRDPWEVPREQVDEAVRLAFRVFKVRGFYADVALWESYIANWAEDFAEGLGVKASTANAIAWDMRQSLQKVTRTHERFLNAILNQKVFYDGDPRLRHHALNVYRRDNSWGTSFGKQSRESPRKVDLYAAWMLAHECLNDYLLRGTAEPARDTRAWFL